MNIKNKKELDYLFIEYKNYAVECLENFIIPIIDKNIQDIIAIKITIPHQSRQEAKRLLELAKFTVENAIKNGE